MSIMELVVVLKYIFSAIFTILLNTTVSMLTLFASILKSYCTSVLTFKITIVAIIIHASKFVRHLWTHFVFSDLDVEVHWHNQDQLVINLIHREDFGIGGRAQYEVNSVIACLVLWDNLTLDEVISWVIVTIISDNWNVAQKDRKVIFA